MDNHDDTIIYNNTGTQVSTEKLDTKSKKRNWCKTGCKAWCRKYFWEGQLQRNKLSEDGETYVKAEGPFTNLSPSYRKVLAFVLPGLLFHVAWWSVMIEKKMWYVFPEKYYMAITMIFGSVIAGMTSEGGGAVAFPVMTLAFKVNPTIARDFSMMIQSCGMTAAAFAIFFMKVHVEVNALVWSTLGGAVGLVFGLEVVDPVLTPPQKKMGFVSIWFSFAFALFLLNRNRHRPTFNNLSNVKWWKYFVLFLVGIVGGMFSSFAGSGLDICSFSVLTLLFRISEKVATPTSTILMAGNSVIGFFWRGLIMNGISQDAWEFFMSSIPVVTLGAPIGSLLGTHFHRLVLASFVYIIDTVALASAFAIVPQTPVLIGSSIGIIAAGFLIFIAITKAGECLLTQPTVHQDGNDTKLLKKDPTKANGMKAMDTIDGSLAAHEVYVLEDDIKIEPTEPILVEADRLIEGNFKRNSMTAITKL